MFIQIDTEKLKREIAFMDSADLLYTVKRCTDYLQHHNKNTTKAQDSAIDTISSFVNALLSLDPSVHLGDRVIVTRVEDFDNRHNIHKEDIGTIIECDYKGDMSLVRFDNKLPDEWWMNNNQLAVLREIR